jgi:hypothetical protein
MHKFYISVLISVYSTCFEHPSIHSQEDLYMQFYGIAFMRPYQQSGRYQARPSIDQIAYMDAWKKYNKTVWASLPENEHLDVRNMSKAL